MPDFKIMRFPKGEIVAPPAKSLAHRALICAYLAGGGEVINSGESLDVQATVDCLHALDKGSVLDPRHSASTLRFLLPMTAALGKNTQFKLTDRLRLRLGDAYKTCLNYKISNDILTVSSGLNGNSFVISGSESSQYLTGLLLALPVDGRGGEILISDELCSKPYIEQTISVMKMFGISVHNVNYKKFSVDEGAVYQPCCYEVEGDYSGASVFLAAAAQGCQLTVGGLNQHSIQGDVAILALLQDMGCRLEWHENKISVNAPARLQAISFEADNIPDLVPILAALCACAEGKSEIKNCIRLRLKECDRIQAIIDALTACGVENHFSGGNLYIIGRKRLSSAHIITQHDHRIAMMAALLAIKAEKIIIDDAACVKKSYPNFWQDFSRCEK